MANLTVTAPENSQNIDSVITLNAPLEKVFEAFTKEELFALWWCRGNEVKVYHFDATDGGFWHIAEQTPDGTEYAFRGCFHEIAENERVVQTFEFLGMPERGHVALERADFKAIAPDVTEIKSVSTFQTIEDRDGMIASGMEDGYRQSVEALGKLLEK